MLLKIGSALGMFGSALALFIGVVDGNGKFLLLPFSVTFSASVIALAISEFNKSTE